MPHPVRRAAALVAVALLTIAACGGDDDDATPTSGATDDGGTAGGPTSAGTDDTGGTAPSSLEFTAVDIDFEQEEAAAAAGEIEVVLVNEGAIEHSWLVEGHEPALRLHVQSSGDTDEGTINLDAGEYEYYCDIPGHRAAGMEGTLTVG
jgi:plastocyanin